ncbi:MAG: hypothetical protein WCD18_09545 [Thermosynechococcaceae cyanobacterium]
MTPDDAIYILDTIFRNQPFNDTKEKVFRQIWEGQTYEEIAEDLDYEISYVKQVGARLFRSLSQVLGLKVTKSNCHAVFRQVKIYLDSEKSDPELQRHLNYGNIFDEKFKKIIQLSRSEILNSDSLIKLNIDQKFYENFLKNVRFEDLLIDLINYPHLRKDLFHKYLNFKLKKQFNKYEK